MLNLEKTYLGILIGIIILINPFISSFIAFPLFLLLAMLIFQNNVYNLLYVIVFFVSLSIPIRWSTPDSFFSSGFSMLYIVATILAIMFFSNRKYYFPRYFHLEYFFVYIILTLLLLIIRWENIIYSIFVFRDYVLIISLYPFIVHALIKGKIDFDKLIIVYFSSISFAAFLNLIVYLGYLEFPFDAITYTRSGGNPSYRTIMGVDIIRMGSILGTSTGGTAMLYFFMIPFGMHYFINSRLLIYKMLSFSSIIIGALTIFYLVSFTSILVIFIFVVVYLISILKISKSKLLIGIPVILLLLFVIANIVTITTYKWDFELQDNYSVELSLFSYGIVIVENFIEPVWDSINFTTFLTGIAFDIKTGFEGVVTRVTKRDFGFISSFVSHGILGLIITIGIFYNGISKSFILLTKLKNNNLITISLISMFISSLFFLHGFVITTRPLDLFFLISYVGIIYTYHKNVRLLGH